MTPADVLRVIQQRIFLILLVTVLGSALTVGITMAVQRYFPLYTANAMIQALSPNPEDPFHPFQRDLNRDTIERTLADQSSRIRDPELLRRVLATPEIRETGWFRQFGDDVNAALEELDDELVSAPVRGSSLLRVAMSTRHPKDAPIIVNKVVEEYLKGVQLWSRSRFTDEADTFQEQLRQKDQELSRIDEQISSLKREAQIPAMFEGAPTVTVRLQSLQAELVRREADMELLHSRYDIYSKMSGEDALQLPEISQQVESDPKIAYLTRDVRSLNEQREAMSQRLGENHRDMRALSKRIAMAEEELARLRQIKTEDELKSLEAQYKSAYFATLQVVSELQDSVRETEQLQIDLDSKRDTYERLLRQRQRLESERQDLAAAHRDRLAVAQSKRPVQIHQVQRATKPLEPSRPKPLLWIPAGVAMSGLLAVGLALGLTLLDTSLQTPRDVIRHANLPLLGTVPVLDDEEAAVEDIETAARVAPHSLVAECFRQIRANLLFSAPMEQQRTVLVTSASPEEGKTCVAINLAVTLAQGGRKILLLDANFRRPSLHKAFSVPNHKGLSNLLVGQGSLDDFVCQTDLPNLDVLASGPCPPNPAELLTSNYLRDTLARAAETYDQIIIDGPPVLLVSDAVVLSAIMDGTVLVCRARTGRGLVQRAKTQLGLVNSRIIGAVLNAVETTRGGYFRKYYREFYDYHEEMEAEEPPVAELDALPSVDRDDDEAALDKLATGDVETEDEFKPPEIDEKGSDADFFLDDDIDLSLDDDDVDGKEDDEEPRA